MIFTEKNLDRVFDEIFTLLYNHDTVDVVLCDDKAEDRIEISGRTASVYANFKTDSNKRGLFHVLTAIEEMLKLDAAHSTITKEKINKLNLHSSLVTNLLNNSTWTLKNMITYLYAWHKYNTAQSKPAEPKKPGADNYPIEKIVSGYRELMELPLTTIAEVHEVPIKVRVEALPMYLQLKILCEADTALYPALVGIYGAEAVDGSLKECLDSVKAISKTTDLKIKITTILLKQI